MVTIKEVAQKAGVSKSTVSRVINETGLVNGETAERVYAAIKELNYKPNQIARTLFSKRSNVIGLIVPRTSHNFFSMLVDRVDYYLFKEGYNLMLASAQYDQGKEIEYLDLLKRHLVDGIIIASHTLGLNEYSDINLPVVTFDRIVSKDVPFVHSDNYNGGKIATEHLINKGCKCLAHIAGSELLDSPAHERGYAFEDVCKEHNIKYKIVHMELNKFGYEEGHMKVKELLKEHPEIDGIFASNDELGIGAIKAANELGLNVPDDLQIIGYDDVTISKISIPELTTIRQPIDDIAKNLVESLLFMIKNPNEVVPKNIVVPVQLIERQSTK